jgi:glycosyltransferase involved in cell wall biosynthesis
LEAQDIPPDSYEIICINDGSPDNSKQLIEKLQKEFSNIILINQENQGVSMARNNGIALAKGNYILFVDPDDALQNNCLSELIEYAESNQYEVVFSPFTFVEINGDQKKSKYSDDLEKLMDGTTLYHAVRGDKVIDPDRSVAILYKRALFQENDLQYLKGVPYLEDGEFIARILCLTKRGSVYNKPYYLRLNRPGSATQSDLFTQTRSIKGFLLAAKNLIKFKTKESLNQRQRTFLNQPICKFAILAIQACTTKRDFKAFKFVKKELKNNSISILNLKGCNATYTKLGKIFNTSLNYLFFYLILKDILVSLKVRLVR